jgi:hypothetical protein
MTFLNEFRRQVEDFLHQHRMPASQLGMLALGDPNFVGDLRRGRNPTLRIHEQVTTYMARHSKRIIKDASTGLERVAAYQPTKKNRKT